MAGKQKDPRIDKRKVTMTNWVTVAQDEDGPDGPVRIEKHEAVDYVRPDFLDAYVEDARTRWQQVRISDEPDAGPGGYDGATSVPAGLSHPLAGQTFPATPQDKKD